ncbi:MAG: serine/threonine-protein kinase [Dehalococcoidia bacterium]
MRDLKPGTTLGEFRIDAKIGEGGMAAVYRATQPSLHRTVAIKVLDTSLLADPTFVARFQREADTVAKLMHPNIVPVYAFGEAGVTLYLAMGFVPGGSLAERMARPLDLQTVGRIVRQVAEALDYAHKQGVVHRDIKPANILLGEGDWALLSDFGIARMLEGRMRLTQPGVGLGTPEYMSPEQGLSDDIDGRSDIYSLGIVLYELITGEVPFDADTPFGILYKQVHEPLPLPSKIKPEISSALENVIIRATAKRPEDRYQTAEQFKTALEAAIPAEAAPASPVVSKIRGVLFDLESETDGAKKSDGAAHRAGRSARHASPSGQHRSERSISPMVWVLAAIGGLLGLVVIVVIVLSAVLGR